MIKLDALGANFSARYRFSEWPEVSRTVPGVAAGVYAIWDCEVLVYVGMSGRQLERNLHKSRYGLITRLESHWSGRLSGDQFCVYVANRLVIPDLRPEQLASFRDGGMTLDALVRAYIRDRLEFQHSVLKTSSAALELERRGRSGALFGLKPLLNPP